MISISTLIFDKLCYPLLSPVSLKRYNKSNPKKNLNHYTTGPKYQKALSPPNPSYILTAPLSSLQHNKHHPLPPRHRLPNKSRPNTPTLTLRVYEQRDERGE